MLFFIDFQPPCPLCAKMVKASPNKDVALDNKVKLVMEMGLFKVGLH